MGGRSQAARAPAPRTPTVTIGEPDERFASGSGVPAAEIVCLQQVGEQLAARFGEGPWLLPGPFLNTDQLERAGLAYATVERVAADLLGACPSVERVWTRSELLEDTSDTAAHDDLRPLFVNGFHPDRSPDLTLQFEPFFVPTVPEGLDGVDLIGRVGMLAH